MLLLFDYDGTLTSIVARPAQAILPATVREKLLILAGRPDYSIGIVSGRSLTEIREIVGLDGLYYAGNHGLEINGPGIDFTSVPATEAGTTIQSLSRDLAEGLQNIEGVIIQDKGLSLSVNYRMVKSEAEKDVAAIVHRVTAPLVETGSIKLFTGKKIWEVKLPVDWDKGKAVETIRSEVMKKVNVGCLLTAFFGDDLTDEDAFKVLRRPAGWGVYVGGENLDSAACCYLNSTAEVEEFLLRAIEVNR